MAEESALSALPYQFSKASIIKNGENATAPAYMRARNLAESQSVRNLKKMQPGAESVPIMHLT